MTDAPDKPRHALSRDFRRDAGFADMVRCRGAAYAAVTSSTARSPLSVRG